MKVTVMSPWYPNRAAPYSGVFVEKGAEAVRALGSSVEVEVPTIFPAPPGPIPANVAGSMERLADTAPTAMFEQEGDTTWIPSPVPARSGYMGRARSFVTAVEAKRRHFPMRGDLTHAHLGVPTGWAALTLGDSPLVITEHQSTLGDLLGEPAARDAYLEVLRRADAFICVSEVLRKQLEEAYGPDASRIEVIPNVVDLTEIPFESRPAPGFSSWIYVGGLTPGKGVQRLLETFSTYRTAYDPGATLTLVGGGTLGPWVERFASERGLGQAIRLAGPRPHAELGPFLSSADVMVHLSEYETFGISCLEGIGAGLPVISLRNGGADATWGDMEEACGLLLDRASKPEDVAAGIAHLKERPGRLDPHAGRAMVEQRYSPNSVGTALLDVYRRCLG